eukprot:6286427-Ditylum_brightwellii.AAC.1
MFDEDGCKEEEDEDGSQDLLGPNMVQTLLKPYKKGKEIIDVEHENSSMSEDSTDMSAFKVPPFKEARLAASKKEDAGKGGRKEVDKKKKGGKSVSTTSSVSDDAKLLKVKQPQDQTRLYPLLHHAATDESEGGGEGC